MGHLSLVAAMAIFALFGWGWLQHFFQWLTPDFMRSEARQEQRQEDAPASTSEPIHVDAEFDTELNEMNREMDSIQAQGDADLKAMEQQQ